MMRSITSRTPRAPRRLALQSLAALALAGTGLSVLAQPTTDRPIRIIVGVPPGSSTDLIARIFSDHLARQLG